MGRLMERRGEEALGGLGLIDRPVAADLGAAGLRLRICGARIGFEAASACWSRTPSCERSLSSFGARTSG